jgi:hypothetical protein
MTLLKKSNEEDMVDDPLLELPKKCGGVFPECPMIQNWLQGMRNYVASAAHCGAAFTMSKLFHHLNSKELYFDFLVHSDDWVICYGFCTPDIMHVTSYEFTWRERLNIQSEADMDRFMYTAIWMVYKLNNLNVSVKKGSISDKFIEFVSFIVNGGSCCMGYEKQLLSIYSEKLCKGSLEDCISLLSQSSSAVYKGSDSTVVGMFIHDAMKRLRHDYSMGPGEKFDAVKWFDVDRDHLPLYMLPEIAASSLDMALSTVNLHDHILTDELFSRIVLHPCTDEKLLNSARLVIALSSLQLGKKTSFSCSLEIDPSVNFIPGMCFRPKNVEDLLENIEANNVFSPSFIKLAMMIDFTSTIMKPKDFMFSLLQSHSKLLDHDVLVALSGRSKINLLRARDDFKNKKSVKFQSEDGYDSLSNCYAKAQSWSSMIDEPELTTMLTNLHLLSENLNTADKQVAAWLQESKYSFTTMPKRKTRALISMPAMSKGDEFVNLIRVLLVHTVNPRRFELNNVVIPHPVSYECDQKTPAELMVKSCFLKCRTESEKKKNLELLCKFAPHIESTIRMLTAPKRTTMNLETCLRWLKQNNTFLYVKAVSNSTARLQRAVQVVGEAKKNRLYCQNEVAELALLTRLQINTGKNLRITSREGVPIHEVVASLKEECMMRGVDMSDKYKLMCAFLEFYHTGKSDQCTQNFSQEFSMTYLKKDEKLHRKSPYENAEVLITKGSSKTIFSFSNGVLHIYCNHSSESPQLRESIRHFWARHKNNYSLDGYRYFQSRTEAEYADPSGLYAVGHNGYYEIVTPRDVRFDHQICVGRVYENRVISHKTEDYEVRLTKEMTCKIEESTVGSLDFKYKFVSCNKYMLHGWDGLVNVNKIIDENLLYDFIYDLPFVVRFDMDTVWNETRVVEEDLKYIYYYIFELGRWDKKFKGYYRNIHDSVADEIFERSRNVVQLEAGLSYSEDDALGHIPEMVPEQSDDSFSISSNSSSSSNETCASYSSTSSTSKESDKEKESEHKITLKYTEEGRKRLKENSLHDLDLWTVQTCYKMKASDVDYLDILVLIECIFSDLDYEYEFKFQNLKSEEISELNLFIAFFKYTALYPQFKKKPNHTRTEFAKRQGEYRWGDRRWPDVIRRVMGIGLKSFSSPPD